MLRLIAIAAAAWLAAAGTALADDCSPEGVAGSQRTPVAAFGGHAVVLASSWVDLEGRGTHLDDTSVTAYTLGDPHPVVIPPEKALSPSLVGGQVVEWTPGLPDQIVTTPAGERAPTRTLVPGVGFPGYRGLAAAAGPDGTLTLVYGVRSGDGFTAVARRVEPERSGDERAARGRWTVGPATALPVSGDELVPRLAVDAQGTAFAVVRGAGAGVALRWPAGGAPQVLPSPALRDAGFPEEMPAVVPDAHGGAWFRLAGTSPLKLAHVTAAGLTITPVARADESADPAVDAAGDALVAWSRHGRASLTRVGARTRSLGAGRVQALALDPRDGSPAVLLTRGRALLLVRPGGLPVTLRDRRGDDEGEGSLAFASDGRAFAVWEETSVRLDPECREFPASAAVRWESVAPSGLRGPSHRLQGAPLITG